MVVREGARKMLQAALELEVDEFLGRRRYQRTSASGHRGYRNGHLPERTIGVGMGAVEVSLPRLRKTPPEVSADGFHSEIVSRYQLRSRTQARLLARLYLEGLATATAKLTTEDADAIAAYRETQAGLNQILRLIADTPLDLIGISAIRGALRRQEISLTNEEERQEVDDHADAGRQLRVGRGWLQAKLIRGYGPLYLRGDLLA
jgi:hypothetical protein